MKYLVLLVLLFSGCTKAKVSPPPTKDPSVFDATQRPRNLTDDQLLDLVQKQTFGYFWDFGHPTSGMARERNNPSTLDVVTTGGTGFGIMAIIVAADRQWITREEAATRIYKIVSFLERADRFHGVFPHWMNGVTGKVIPFSALDDGGDLVETSFLMEGLICARQYFNGTSTLETDLRTHIQTMWIAVEWNWHTQGGQNVLYWHWSPNNAWRMNLQLHGWNESLVTYVLAASSPNFAINRAVYDQGWASGPEFRNGSNYYGTRLPLGPDSGGPLFFSHYSFLGLNPHLLRDQYADYWTQNQNHTLINYQYCVANPKGFRGYGPNSWGLTASDNYQGYSAHSPTNDLGVISPTAALSAFPYAPQQSMAALKHFYNDLGDNLWGPYGFYDAYSEDRNWQATSYLAIDQGPIVGMIENHRTGLLWRLFMSSPDVQRGLGNLGF